MIDSNNIEVMRENIKELSQRASVDPGVIEQIYEDINTLSGEIVDLTSEVDENRTNISTINSTLDNTTQQLFFGNGRGRFYRTSIQNIDDCVNNTVNPTSDEDGYFSIDNLATVSGMGNHQFIFGWVNKTKTYGWCFCMGFFGCRYGRRNNNSAFSFTTLA